MRYRLYLPKRTPEGRKGREEAADASGISAMRGRVAEL